MNKTKKNGKMRTKKKTKQKTEEKEKQITYSWHEIESFFIFSFWELISLFHFCFVLDIFHLFI